MFRSTRLLVASICILAAAQTPSDADVTETRNFYQFSEQLLTSGQPNEDVLKSASEDGIEVVINLVPSTESIYNPKEGEILAAQGIEYIHIPVSWRSPDGADMKTFLAAMRKAGDRKVLVHCWSNARASAFAYAHRVAEAPEMQDAEWEQLRKVWSDVAGYQLDNDNVWQSYLAENVQGAN